MEKWEIEGKIHDGYRNTINRYFELFEEHIADDMIIYGKDYQEHDGHFLNFLEACRKKQSNTEC